MSFDPHRSLDRMKKGESVFVVFIGFRRNAERRGVGYLPILSAGPKFVTVEINGSRYRFNVANGIGADSAPYIAFTSERAAQIDEERRHLSAGIRRAVADLSDRLSGLHVEDLRRFARALGVEPFPAPNDRSSES